MNVKKYYGTNCEICIIFYESIVFCLMKLYYKAKKCTSVSVKIVEEAGGTDDEFIGIKCAGRMGIL